MRSSILKTLSAVIALIMIVTLIPLSAVAAPEGITAGAYVLIDAETGQVLLEKNMDQQLYPASITKIMTVLLAVENANPDTVVKVSADATIIDKPDYSDSMNISLSPGEEIRLEDLMYATIIESANDAANCVAEAVSGSIEEFAKLMNERAIQLGAKNTNFVNPHGLPDDAHVTTAYDMAQITRFAITNERFVNIFSTIIYEISPTNKMNKVRTISTGFSMLKRSDPNYYEGIIGGKTGYTVPAGYTGVAAAKRGDTTLIAVVLGSTSGANRFSDLKALLDYGFDNFVKTPITTADVKPTVSQVVENDLVVATVAISPSSDLYYLRHKSVPESDVNYSLDIKSSYSWYDIQPSVNLSLSDGTYMYPNIGSFLLSHTEKQLTNPIPVSTNTSNSAKESETNSNDSTPHNNGMSPGLRVFLIIIAVLLIIIGALVLLFFISNMRRRKRDKLRRLRRQEMYEKSRREQLASKEKK